MRMRRTIMSGATQRFAAMRQLRQLVDRILKNESTNDLGIAQDFHRVSKLNLRSTVGLC
jgi:hypothetical protein